MPFTVEQELAEKVRLERRFVPELRRIFGSIATAFQTEAAITGMPPRRESFETPFAAVLENHYSRVQKHFRGQVTGLIAQAKAEDDTEGIEALIALALLTWRNEISRSRAREIALTNEAEMHAALDRARRNISERGEELTNRAVAAEAANILRRGFAGRLNRIALTETQAPAESTKLIEAQVVAGALPFILTGGAVVLPETRTREVTKTWRSMRDRRVRPTHVEVDGTVLGVNGVFRVGTSRLRFPADPGLGASVGEIINCRCAAVYDVRE